MTDMTFRTFVIVNPASAGGESVGRLPLSVDLLPHALRLKV